MSMSQSPKNSCHKNPFHSPKNKKNRRIVEYNNKYNGKNKPWKKISKKFNKKHLTSKNFNVKRCKVRAPSSVGRAADS